MGVGILIGQKLDVFLHWRAAVEDRRLDLRHILAEASIFVLDLICQLASVAHYQDRCLALNRLDLLQSGEDEDSGLTKTGFGLAKDICSKDGLRNAYLLDCNEERS